MFVDAMVSSISGAGLRLRYSLVSEVSIVKRINPETMAVSPANTARAKSYKMMRVVKSLPHKWSHFGQVGRSLLLFTVVKEDLVAV